jgi:ubiquinone/menaquinone biosynthesis C-methylase UbiE
LFTIILSTTKINSSFAFVASIDLMTQHVLKSDVIVTAPKQQQVEDSDHVLDKESTSLANTNVKAHRSKWGVDNEHPGEYWFDDRIHVLGNRGFLGAFHAAIAPLSTKLIDDAAYGGVDVRTMLSEELSKVVRKQKTRVLDLCCGVGMSTRALAKAFPDADCVLGIDTSSEMIAMAHYITHHLAHVKPFFDLVTNKISDSYVAMQRKGYALRQRTHFCHTRFARSNAENTMLPAESFDLVTIMYGFHEVPKAGRQAMLQEARRLLTPGGTLAVIDISVDYKPSASMLRGEPYVTEYQQNIHNQIFSSEGFGRKSYRDVVPNHLGMWLLQRTAVETTKKIRHTPPKHSFMMGTIQDRPSIPPKTTWA